MTSLIEFTTYAQVVGFTSFISAFSQFVNLLKLIDECGSIKDKFEEKRKTNKTFGFKERFSLRIENSFEKVDQIKQYIKLLAWLFFVSFPSVIIYAISLKLQVLSTDVWYGKTITIINWATFILYPTAALFFWYKILNIYFTVINLKSEFQKIKEK